LVGAIALFHHPFYCFGKMLKALCFLSVDDHNARKMFEMFCETQSTK
jgi:hypothetical protein